ncbi:MAG: hypothetical protein LPK14_04515 [Hymenobacteraceae bacterium]|nr:hypothetical protein [Hymenobacteraceae bacterium]MDX5421494.1 hypothetical protein [Hymenobacteraceae bacterium]
MVVLTTPFVDITYLGNEDTLLIRWLQLPDAAAFREAYLSALAFVSRHRLTTNYCTDLTLIGALTKEQEHWLHLDFYPQVYKVIRKSIQAAVVFSEEHFNAIITHYQVPDSLPEQRFIDFNYFTDLAQALHWIADIKKGQGDTLLTAAP